MNNTTMAIAIAGVCTLVFGMMWNAFSDFGDYNRLKNDLDSLLISFNTFQKLYDSDPSCWTLCYGCVILDEYNRETRIVFETFSDYKRYEKWLEKRLEKQHKEKRNLEQNRLNDILNEKMDMI